MHIPRYERCVGAVCEEEQTALLRQWVSAHLMPLLLSLGASPEDGVSVEHEFVPYIDMRMEGVVLADLVRVATPPIYTHTHIFMYTYTD